MSENIDKKITKERTLVSFDWALKSILRDEKNLDILQGFLRELLGDKKLEIEGFLESESNKNNENEKFNRVDLRAKDSKNREIIIEVQYNTEPDYLERIYYGTCKSVVENMGGGFKFGQVKKIISVSIVYFDLADDGYLMRYATKGEDLVNLANPVKNKQQGKFAEYYIIQPKKFDENVQKDIDEWIYFFKKSEIRAEAKSEVFDKVREKLDFAKMTPQEQKDYRDYQLNKAINDGVLEVAKEKGKTEGRIEEKAEIAKKLLEVLDVNIIAEKTGLTVEYVQNLKDNQS